MEFRETTAEDLEYLADHSVSRGIQSKCPEQIDYCYTLEHEGKPLCVGGFKLINVTTAWSWIEISDAAGNHVIPMYRVIREYIDVFVKEHNIIRAQAYVECDFPEAERMVVHLGFEKESIMKKFMGDKDAYMFAKLL